MLVVGLSVGRAVGLVGNDVGCVGLEVETGTGVGAIVGRVGLDVGSEVEHEQSKPHALHVASGFPEKMQALQAGAQVGLLVGLIVGAVGEEDGAGVEGEAEGVLLGNAVGCRVAPGRVGVNVGALLGVVGAFVGSCEGAPVVGRFVGLSVGLVVGNCPAGVQAQSKPHAMHVARGMEAKVQFLQADEQGAVGRVVVG